MPGKLSQSLPKSSIIPIFKDKLLLVFIKPFGPLSVQLKNVFISGFYDINVHGRANAHKSFIVICAKKKHPVIEKQESLILFKM